MSSLRGGEVALCANERFLSTMNQHVSFQIISFHAPVAALVATVGLLPIMLNHMCLEAFDHFEGDIALKT